MRLARVTVFAGHFGSGKTSIAIAYALWAKQQEEHVLLCDLDIMNPYSKMADAADALAKAGIRVIASRFANTNVDAPAMPVEALAVFDDSDITGIIDLGGDNHGALALGRYADFLRNGGDYEMLLVLNQYRPLTRSFSDLYEIKNEIEIASKVGFTGLINNSNLAAETTLQDVIATADFAAKASEKLALPLKMTVLDERLIQSAEAKEMALLAMGELFPMTPYKNKL
ncbi:MAG: hypothetical protein FWE97_02065 [Dehalococcoidia bacterium]|nr:hypothetical protein [Dehalococcoidia bacterium]